jgi:uncharacterized membrane protein YhhN
VLNFWLFLVVLLIAADWTAVWQGWHRVNYFTKPAVLLLLSIWFWTVSVPDGPALWFGLGLFFSLIGDVFFLFPNRYFIHGWAAFLIAQVAYVIWFNCCLPPISAYFWLLLGANVCVWVVVAAVMVKNLSKNPSHRKMVFPVVIYAAAISAMLFSAIWTLFRPDWTALASGLAASGALLFSCSDLLLALDRFIRPFPRGRLWVRVTYHLGQLALTAGAALFGGYSGINLS